MGIFSSSALSRLNGRFGGGDSQPMVTNIPEMRQRFDAQQTLGQIPIDEVELPTKTRFQRANLLEALQYMYTHPKWNRRVFSLLEETIMADKKRTGRTRLSAAPDQCNHSAVGPPDV